MKSPLQRNNELQKQLNAISARYEKLERDYDDQTAQRWYSGCCALCNYVIDAHIGDALKCPFAATNWKEIGA